MATPPFGWTVPVGYEFDNLSRCGSCGADIAWTITRKGNRAPLNPDGISHFATCPNASDHRRRPESNAAPMDAADRERTGSQREAVRAILSDGRWYTLAYLARRVGGSEAGVSARLRDLRKPEHGSYTIERRRVSGGLNEYRMGGTR